MVVNMAMPNEPGCDQQRMQRDQKTLDEAREPYQVV